MAICDRTAPEHWHAHNIANIYHIHNWNIRLRRQCLTRFAFHFGYLFCYCCCFCTKFSNQIKKEQNIHEKKSTVSVSNLIQLWRQLEIRWGEKKTARMVRTHIIFVAVVLLRYIQIIKGAVSACQKLHKRLRAMRLNAKRLFRLQHYLTISIKTSREEHKRIFFLLFSVATFGCFIRTNCALFQLVFVSCEFPS